MNARAFGPRTLYRVGGFAGTSCGAWVSHIMVNYWIYDFQAILLLCYYIFVLDRRNTVWLCDTVRQTSLGKSAPCPAAADFPRDVCLTVSRNHAVFLLSPLQSQAIPWTKANRLLFGTLGTNPSETNQSINLCIQNGRLLYVGHFFASLNVWNG